jgi:endonuclease III
MLLMLHSSALASPKQLADSTVGVLQEIINDSDPTNLAGATIHSIATEVMKAPHNGMVPATKKALIAVKVDEDVASLLMSHVFGSTEMAIGLHARKIVCALDLFDWEDSGATKQDLKMAKVTASQVKRSLCTWVPKGEGRTFLVTLEALGENIGRNEIGFWGKMTKVINERFSPKDKKLLHDMLTKIAQFHKSTRSGGKRKCQ